MTTTPYTYRGIITKVHDGDTVRATLDLNATSRMSDRDLGFHLAIVNHRFVWNWPIRLAACNAPELATPDGVIAQKALVAFVPIGQAIEVHTHLVQIPELDLYERVLGEIYRVKPDGSVEKRTASSFMIDGGWAAAWDGQGPKPLPPSPVPVAPVSVPYV